MTGWPGSGPGFAISGIVPEKWIRRGRKNRTDPNANAAEKFVNIYIVLLWVFFAVGLTIMGFWGSSLFGE